MFWTDTLVQKSLFGDDEHQASSTVAQLIRFAQTAFPNADSNLHRQIAFLTHRATQDFLVPMLVRRYGSIDESKDAVMAWLDELGSLETFARSTRKCNGDGNGVITTRPAKMPDWYCRYMKTDRYADTKRQAEMYWADYMDGLSCSMNARDEYQVLHHRDYARIGEADEFRYLVPLCHACHASVSIRGPRVPAVIPEAVKKWL